MRLAIFAAGFGLGIAATLWAIGRSMVTALEEPADEPWGDAYTEQLAAILEREYGA